MVKIAFNLKYFFAFIAVFATELLIAIFIKGGFIREHLGDVLVVILIYCFIKSFIRSQNKFLWIYIFIFAALVELGQYFNFVELIGLGEYRLARIVFGTIFDVRDIVSYFIGCVGILCFEGLKNYKAND